MKPKNLIKQYGNLEMIRDIWALIKPYKKQFWLGTFARVTGDLVWLFPPYAISEIITFAAEHKTGESITYFWQLAILLLVVGLYHFTFQQLAKYFIYPLAEKVRIDLRLKTIKHMFDLDASWHAKENTGNKMEKMAKGGESINQIIRIYVDLLIESTISLVAISFIFYTLDWKLNAILIFFFISYYFLSYFLTKRAVLQSHKANLKWEEFGGMSFESINNINSIKAMDIGLKIFPFLSEISQKLEKEIKKRIKYYRTREGILNIYQEFFRLGLVIFTVLQIFQGNLEVGIIAMVFMYFGKIEESAYEFSKTYSQFVTSKIALMRVKEILNKAPHIENSGTLSFKKNWKELEFKDITFSYHGHKVLKNFSLKIKKGEKIGIIGISGTGKSTLFKLILKLYQDYKGDILFDKTNLKDIKRKSYLKTITIVPQETELFNLSLEENITLSRKRKNKKLLETALKISHVKDFTHKLLHGTKSLIGEKGIKLSGGEKQRVGIARAVYKNPEILLLDEATSHLDILSEQKIQDALHTFFKGITAIVIAHRLPTIKEMDRIIVMDKGSIIESGTFKELMKQKGEFHKLWEKQKF